jgi:hypothetical protein
VAADAVDMWVVYDHPTDLPDWYVVRRWSVRTDGTLGVDAVCALAPTLELARQAVPAGTVRAAPYPDDDPKICEVWL